MFICSIHTLSPSLCHLCNGLQGYWGQRRYIPACRYTCRSPLCCCSVSERSTDAEWIQHTHPHLQVEMQDLCEEATFKCKVKGTLRNLFLTPTVKPLAQMPKAPTFCGVSLCSSVSLEPDEQSPSELSVSEHTACFWKQQMFTVCTVCC